jgi:hypothetical protein
MSHDKSKQGLHFKMTGNVGDGISLLFIMDDGRGFEASLPERHVLEILKKRGYRIEAPEASTELTAPLVN